MFICPAGHHVDHILPKRQLTFKLFVFVYQTVYPFLLLKKKMFFLTNQLIYEHKPLKIFAAVPPVVQTTRQIKCQQKKERRRRYEKVFLACHLCPNKVVQRRRRKQLGGLDIYTHPQQKLLFCRHEFTFRLETSTV